MNTTLQNKWDLFAIAVKKIHLYINIQIDIFVFLKQYNFTRC